MRYRNTPGLKVVKAPDILDALVAARTDTEFKPLTIDWLSTHLPLYHHALNNTFAINLQKKSEDIAIAAQLGMTLGGRIMQGLVERGAVDLITARGNTATHLGTSTPRTAGVIEPAQIHADFTADAAEALITIRHETARTLCVSGLEYCLTTKLS